MSIFGSAGDHGDQTNIHAYTSYTHKHIHMQSHTWFMGIKQTYTHTHTYTCKYTHNHTQNLSMISIVYPFYI